MVAVEVLDCVGVEVLVLVEVEVLVRVEVEVFVVPGWVLESMSVKDRLVIRGLLVEVLDWVRGLKGRLRHRSKFLVGFRCSDLGRGTSHRIPKFAFLRPSGSLFYLRYYRRGQGLCTLVLGFLGILLANTWY